MIGPLHILFYFRESLSYGHKMVEHMCEPPPQ